ncbi:MAG: T9SS type A sorting domain-containing protein [Ignavibacteriae bacterium]|nr:T9SS type A sorting domain-containing protein [Ignavibacteriota bacterium]
MSKIFVAALVLLCASLQDLKAQTDSLVDVLPLAVGNQWTYRYFTLYDYAPAGDPTETRTDSGLAVYSVLDRIANADSIRWQFRVRRDLLRHQILWHAGRDTIYAIRDSTSFELIENNSGQHRLYRNESSTQIRQDVFPFTRAFTDTTSVWRYRRVGQGDTVRFRSAEHIVPSQTYASDFTFRRNTGLTRHVFNTGSIDVYSAAHHFLISSRITSRDESRKEGIAERFELEQNYPNPYNPTTNIRFTIQSLPAEVHGTQAGSHFTILKVFDLLGREVATLVNEVKQPGTYTVQWNAKGSASGVYLYRLQAGDFLLTKKMLLLR